MGEKKLEDGGEGLIPEGLLAALFAGLMAGEEPELEESEEPEVHEPTDEELAAFLASIFGADESEGDEPESGEPEPVKTGDKVELSDVLEENVRNQHGWLNKIGALYEALGATAQLLDRAQTVLQELAFGVLASASVMHVVASIQAEDEARAA